MQQVESTVKITACKLYRSMLAVRLIGTLEDVEQVGRLGALSAIERFDPARGCRFATFALLRIKGQIFDAAREAALVRVPRTATNRGEEIRTVQTVGDFRGRPADGEARQAWLIEPSEEARQLTDADAAVARWLTSLDKQGRIIASLYFGLDGQPQRMTALLADARARDFLRDVAREGRC
jgi:RNA polymerase sigma factor (sigma-70 family)